MIRTKAATSELIELIRRPLYRNAFYLWGTSLASAAGGGLFWTVAAHVYAPSAVGIGSATVAALTLLGILAHLGLGDALVRWLPALRAGRSALINTGLTLAALAGAAATVVFLLGIHRWSPGIAYLTSSPWYVVAFAVFVFASSVGPVLMLSFVALRDARHVLTMAVVLEGTRLLLCLPFVFLGGFGLAAASGVGVLASLAAGLWLFARVEPSYAPRPALRRDAAMQLLPFGLANHAADLAMALPGLVLPIMVINTLGPVNSAHFYIGFVMGALLLTGTQALATSLFAEGSTSREALGLATRQALVGALAVAGLGAAALIVSAGWLLLIFGTGYSASAAGLVRVVALAALPGAVTSISLTVLRVLRRLGLLVGLAWAVCLTTLAVAQVLLPRLGIAGAGLGVVAGQSAGALICLAGFVWERARRGMDASYERAEPESVP
jgi:O-antigen/teichoic acid export membrane protein